MNQSYSGRAGYLTDVASPTGTLGVAVVCRVGDRRDRDIALVDTACPWCILPPPIALELGFEVPESGSVRLHSRFGLLAGELMRLPVEFVEEAGEPAEIEATWFLSSEWPGPMVIGWKGCLERTRFGFDPGENDFYFAEI